MGRAVGNIIATIMTTQMERKSSALIPIVRPIPCMPMPAAWRDNSTHAQPARPRSSARIAPYCRRRSGRLEAIMGSSRQYIPIERPRAEAATASHCYRMPKTKVAWRGRSAVGPSDPSVVAVLAGIIPAHAVIRPDAIAISDGQRDGGSEGVRVLRLDFVTGIQRGERLYCHTHHTGYLDGSPLPFDREGDRHRSDAKRVRDERSQLTDRPTVLPKENRLESGALLFIGPFIHIQRDTPVPISHWARRSRNHRRVETVQCDSTILPAIDMEAERHFASARRRPRRHGRARGDETRTHDVTIAVLEIVSHNSPLCSDRRSHAPPRIFCRPAFTGDTPAIRLR